MKNIKFRAWIEKWKEMREVYTIKWEDDGVFIEADQYCSFFKIDEIELMQFTGIKDKNGKEIFEGDIVKFADGEISEVVFHCGCFMTKLKPGECIKLDFDAEPVWKDGEIVGNVFENPELLK